MFPNTLTHISHEMEKASIHPTGKNPKRTSKGGWWGSGKSFQPPSGASPVRGPPASEGDPLRLCSGSGKDNHWACVLLTLNFLDCFSSEAFCATACFSECPVCGGNGHRSRSQGLHTSGKQLGLAERATWVVAISKQPAKQNMADRCFSKLVLMGHSPYDSF